MALLVVLRLQSVTKTGIRVFTVADVTGEADPERGALDGNLAVALLVAIQGS